MKNIDSQYITCTSFKDRGLSPPGIGRNKRLPKYKMSTTINAARAIGGIFFVKNHGSYKWGNKNAQPHLKITTGQEIFSLLGKCTRRLADAVFFLKTSDSKVVLTCKKCKLFSPLIVHCLFEFKILTVNVLSVWLVSYMNPKAIRLTTKPCRKPYKT